MARGPKKHMKRIAAPSHWCLDKLGGIYAPRPSHGPHAMRDCFPLILLLRNRLKYALTYQEAKIIAMQRCIKINGKVRTDMNFPCGFQDVITIEKTGENFRLLYDVKGRFSPHRVQDAEAEYKLCRVIKVGLGLKGIPYVRTADGRTIRFVHPEIKVNDTIRLDLATGKILDFLKFTVGAKAMITGGHNIGRIGTIVSRETHLGTSDIIQIKDERGAVFATKMENVFCIGTSEKYWISLPKDHGVRKTILEERMARLQHIHA